MPPVAKMRMPAMAARIMVAATVVAPDLPAATTNGKSRRLTLVMAAPPWPKTSMSARDSPTLSLPSMMAMVAGTAPCWRTSSSTRSAVATFCGYGMPWAMMVDSSATRGLPWLTACCTSGERSGFMGLIFTRPGRLNERIDKFGIQMVCIRMRSVQGDRRTGHPPLNRLLPGH